MPSFLIYGNDFLVYQEAKRIESDHEAGNLLEGNTTNFDSSNFDISSFQQVINALPFMDPIRMIILDDVIKSNTTLGISILKHLENLPKSTLLIIKEKSDKISPNLTKDASEHLVVQKLQGPRNNRELNQWIKERASYKQLSISPAGIGALGNHVGTNLWNIDNELEKLSLYTQGNQITDLEVKELVYSNQDINIFSTIDAIIEKKRGIAYHNINGLLSDGHDTSSILRLIGRQLRLIATMKSLSGSGFPNSELKNKLGITSNYVIDKITAQSNQASNEKILFMFEQLVQTDLNIKSGTMDDKIALDIFLNQVI